MFICGPGLSGVFEGYAFEERPLNKAEPMAPEVRAKNNWSDLINVHLASWDPQPSVIPRGEGRRVITKQYKT